MKKSYQSLPIKHVKLSSKVTLDMLKHPLEKMMQSVQSSTWCKFARSVYSV